MINIISTPITKHLGWDNSTDNATDFLFIVFPEAAGEVAEIQELNTQIKSRGGQMIHHKEEFALVVNDPGLKFLTDIKLNKAVEEGGILSGRICVGAQKPLSSLDAEIPEGYGGNETVQIGEDEDGNPIYRQKTVREYYLTFEGDIIHDGDNQPNCLIVCFELKDSGANGMVMEEYNRFTNHFTDYYVYDDTKKAQWLENNVTPIPPGV